MYPSHIDPSLELLKELFGNYPFDLASKPSNYVRVVIKPMEKKVEKVKSIAQRPTPQGKTKDKKQSKAIQAINARLVKSELEIKNVIFAGERTIVFFKDGTKTTVQCRGGDTYSKEAGIAFALVKKLLGKYDVGFTEIRGNGYDRLLTDIAEEAIKQEAIRKAVSEKTKALRAKAKVNATDGGTIPTSNIPPKNVPEAGNVSQATQDFVN